MSYEIRFHPAVKKDVSKLDPPVWKRIKKRMESRLLEKPEYFGEPLRGTLKGLWKFRVGDYRIVFQIESDTKMINVLLVAHRKDAYKQIQRRLN